MTCIIAYTNGTNSFIAGDKLGSNGFTHGVVVEPKIFEKKFKKVSENGLNKTEETLSMGYTTSFRMGQLLTYNLELPEQKSNQNFMQYLVLEVVPLLRKLYKDEWGSKDTQQDIGGGNFLILHNHEIYEVQPDFSVLQPKSHIASVGCGTYHAMASMQAFIIAEKVLKPERCTDIFKIVSDSVSGVSSEYDILTY